MSDDDILNEILAREGSAYTDHPSDRGGPTRWGITLATLTDHRDGTVTADDVKNLTEAEARTIYRKRYISAPGFDEIESMELRAALVDFGVNSGPAAAVRALQRVLGLKVDGILGPMTREAANSSNGRSLAVRVHCNRMRFLGRLITDFPSQAVFAAGWLNRVASQIESLV